MAFNRLLRFDSSGPIYPCRNSILDSNLYQKLSNYTENCRFISKIVDFGHHFQLFWSNSTNLDQIRRFLIWIWLNKRSILYQKRSILYLRKNQFCIKKINLISKSDRNRDRRFGFVVGFRIEPKSKIEIDPLEIWIVDDSIRKP